MTSGGGGKVAIYFFPSNYVETHSFFSIDILSFSVKENGGVNTLRKWRKAKEENSRSSEIISRRGYNSIYNISL